MTPDRDAASSGTPEEAVQALVAEAARALSRQTEERWVEVSARVRGRALQATRRALPVRAESPLGPVDISRQVLISYVREAIAVVPHARVQNIEIVVEGRHTYAGVVISISAAYGIPILPIADSMRELAARRLRELLGDRAPAVTTRTLHVHVDDVHLLAPPPPDDAGS